MRRVSHEGAVRTALRLAILNQETGSMEPFVFNTGQVRVLAAILANNLIVILKGRQYGISTIVCLYDLLFAICNPGVEVAIIVDSKDKAIGLLKKCSTWAKKLGIPLTTDNEAKITLANGSTIDAITANRPDNETEESKVGRSATYALLHFSELAYYTRDRAVWAAVTNTALPTAKIIVESTATPAKNLFRAIWDTVEGWTHVFLSVEAHPTYQRDPKELTDDQWRHLQTAHSFTSRPHAAWWWHKVHVKLLGDIHRGLREFPVIPSHGFTYAEGRWIGDPTKATPTVDGFWSYYVSPDKLPEPAVMGVDTAKGVGLDSSAIAVRGHATGRLFATWRSNTTKIPDFTDIVRDAALRWEPVALVIESNGVGCSVFQDLAETVWETVEQKSSDSNGEKEFRMKKVKQDIETGQVHAGPELMLEIESSVIDKKGNYTGPDDLLNAISFAGKWIAANPYKKPLEEVDTTTTVAIAKLLQRPTNRVIF